MQGGKGGEIMNRSKKYAIEAAKEITIAFVSNNETCASQEMGEEVGDFFQAVYKKVEEIAKDVPELKD